MILWWIINLAVLITWSETSGGSSISSFDYGDTVNGVAYADKTLYIRHDGSNPITNCKFYLSGTDAAEVIGWGDGSGDSFGGLLIHMNAVGGFPAADWSIDTDKAPAGKYTFVFRTDSGDTAANGIMIRKAMGTTGDGVIQVGDSPNVRFQIRVDPPVSVNSTGARLVNQVLRFVYTS